MKHVTIVMAAATLVVGCQKTVDQQFRAMCAHQEKNDPQVFAMSRSPCGQADNLSDAQKQTLIDAYAEVRKARDAVEANR